MYGPDTEVQESDVLHPAYRQGMVNIEVEFATEVMQSWQNFSAASKPIFANAGNPHIFDIYTWEPLFEFEDTLSKTETVHARVLASLNGLGGDALENALSIGGDSWLSELMTSKIRYVGHPTNKWDDRTFTTMNRPMGAQVLGIRPFFAFRQTPLHKLVEMRVMTPSEAQEYVMNPPANTTQGKVPAVITPFEMKSIPDNLSMLSGAYLTHKLSFQKQYSQNYNKNSRLTKTLTQLHKTALTFGISFLYAIVRDGVIDLRIPDRTTLPVTTDNPKAVLNLEEAENWIGALASKLGLLPNPNYLQIKRNERSPDVLAKFAQYADIISMTQMPGNNAQLYFGFNKANGTNPGYDIMSRRFLTGTLYGDMINTIANAQKNFLIAVTDWIYYSTRNIVGRVITPAQKGSYGAFI